MEFKTDLSSLWRTGFLGDVTLVLGPEHHEQKVHRAILASGSSFYRALFDTSDKKTAADEEHEKIEDVGAHTPATLVLLEACYTNKIEFPDTSAKMAKLFIEMLRLGMDTDVLIKLMILRMGEFLSDADDNSLNDIMEIVVKFRNRIPAIQTLETKCVEFFFGLTNIPVELAPHYVSWLLDKSYAFPAWTWELVTAVTRVLRYAKAKSLPLDGPRYYFHRRLRFYCYTQIMHLFTHFFLVQELGLSLKEFLIASNLSILRNLGDKQIILKIQTSPIFPASPPSPQALTSAAVLGSSSLWIIE